MTATVTAVLSEVEREVLHHLATTEEGGRTEWFPVRRADGWERVRFAWRCEHQRARLRLAETGLAFGLGGEQCSRGRGLLTSSGWMIVEEDRSGFADWVLTNSG